MAKKQEVVNTWGRLAERVNSKALATQSPQSSENLVGVADAHKAAAAGESPQEADPRSRLIPSGSPTRLHTPHGPELDDVD